MSLGLEFTVENSLGCSLQGLIEFQKLSIQCHFWHVKETLTCEGNVSSLEDEIRKAGWANIFKIRAPVNNSLLIGNIYTLELCGFSAGE